jgi:hypothetical protein
VSRFAKRWTGSGWRPSVVDTDESTESAREHLEHRKKPRWSATRATLAYYRSGAPLLRYWWVLVIGAVAAIGAGILAMDAKRAPYQYTAMSQLLVTSPEAPYFRFSITREGMTRQVEDDPPEVIIDTGPPDTTTLVQAANLYPLLIESDLVAKERTELFGQTSGTLDARAVFSVQTPNRFDESSVPVIEVNGTSTDPEQAIAFTDETVEAFNSWITKQQEAAGVGENQRILIQPISSARVVSQTGGPSYGVPILLGAAVFLAFCGIAVLLDSFARRSRALAAEAFARRSRPLAPEASTPASIHLSQSAGLDGETLRSREIEGSA